MKKTQKTIKFNGLDIKLDIDIADIISAEKTKYKPEIITLRKNIASRDKYIKKLHDEMRDQNNAMYVFIMCTKIHDKVKEVYNITYNDYMVLSYIMDIDHVKIDRIIKYFNNLSIKVRPYRIKKMIEMEYVKKSPKMGYIYITDIGKKVVDAVVGAMKQDYSFYINSKFKKNKIKLTSPDKKNNPKYTPEVRLERSRYYTDMMKPFWSIGSKKIPKDYASRIEIVKKWVNEIDGASENPIYNSLICKWEKQLQAI